MSKNNHWCRHVMDSSTKELINSLNFRELNALEISGKNWKKFPFSSYRNVTYPDFDVTNVASEYIDVYNIVIAEQVFEHVKNPFAGVKNIFNMLQPGGYFLITTPFFLRVHAAPDDYWRWTPAGLRVMLEDCGFEVIKVDSWGNKDCIVDNFYEWPSYQEGMNLSNEPDLPIMVWALGRKK